MPFDHPRLAEIERYTAWRLGCSVELLATPGVATLVADPHRHPWLNNPYSATRPDVICFFRYGETTLLRINANPSPAVRRVLATGRERCEGTQTPVRSGIRSERVG